MNVIVSNNYNQNFTGLNIHRANSVSPVTLNKILKNKEIKKFTKMLSENGNRDLDIYMIKSGRTRKYPQVEIYISYANNNKVSSHLGRMSVKTLLNKSAQGLYDSCKKHW